MQYLVPVIDDKTNSGTPAEMAAINVFNDRLQAEGQWVFAGGLNSPSTATVIEAAAEAFATAVGRWWHGRSRARSDRRP